MNNTSINIKEFNPKYREFYYWPILKTDNYDSVVIPLVKEYEASLTDSSLDNWEDCNKTIEHLFSERAIWGFWTDEPQGNEQYRFNSYSLALILRGYYKYIDQQRRTNFNDSILDHACEELETTDFPSISTKPPFCIKQDPLLKGFHKLLLCSYLSNDGDSDLILNFEVRYGDSRVFNKIRRKALEVLCGSLCPWIESVYEYNHLLYLKNYEVDSIFENGPEDVRKLYVPSKLLASVRDNSDGPITKDTLLDFAKRSTYLYLGGDDDEEIGKIDYQTLMKFRDIFNDYDSGETGEQAAQPRRI